MFEPHGHTDVEVVDQVVLIQASGETNIERTREVIDRIKSAVRSGIDTSRPWATLVDLREWGLATPESEAPMQELQTWLRDQGIRYRAVVSPAGMRRSQLGRILEVEAERVDIRYVRCYDEARAWLIETGVLNPE